jgi:hypothetical protein
MSSMTEPPATAITTVVHTNGGALGAIVRAGATIAASLPPAFLAASDVEDGG